MTETAGGGIGPPPSETTPPEPSRARGRSRLWWVLGGTAGVLAALYVVGWYLSGDRVPRGATVAGVAIGGLTVSDARERLSDELADRQAEPVLVTAGGQRAEIDPADVGLSVDIAATVSAAGGGRSWNPVQIVDDFLGDGGETEPVVTVDESALADEIAAIAAAADREPAEPSVSFDAGGEPVVSDPVVGVTVDQGAAAEAVLGAYAQTDGPLQLPTVRTAPAVGQRALDRALDDVVAPATSEPVTLRLPGRSAQLKVAVYAPALTFAVESGELTPTFDVAALEQNLAPLSARLGERPRDATVELRDGKPVVVPGRPGVTISAEEVADAVIPVLGETGPARQATVGESTAQPDFTTADAKKLKIKELVSDEVTYFPYAEYRNTNQGRAAELINGTVLKPGELFSFNDTVGERTEENGFVVGFIISNGVFAEDLGGGVSQVVTTTYNAAFFAGLDDVEHKPHSFYIDRYPMGREATVAWPTVDLKFRNSTPYGVLIEAWVVPSTVSSQGEMHVRMWSTKYWDITAGLSDQYNFTSPGTRYDSSDACVATTGYGGFDVDVSRTFRRAGSDEVVKRESDHVTYIPADTVICSAPPGN